MIISKFKLALKVKGGRDTAKRMETRVSERSRIGWMVGWSNWSLLAVETDEGELGLTGWIYWLLLVIESVTGLIANRSQ